MDLTNATAVLSGWAGANAICKDGFELVEICAANVPALIDDKPGDMLADTAAHDTGFAGTSLKHAAGNGMIAVSEGDLWLLFR